MKRFLALLLALVFALAFVSCVKKPEPDPETTKPPVTVSPDNTPAATDNAGEKSEDDALFEEIAHDVLVGILTSDGLTYHQFVKDPAYFGIKEEDIERGWGDYTLEAHNESYKENDDVAERLKAVDPEKLSKENRVAYENLTMTLSFAEDTRDMFYYEEPLLPLNGEHTMLPLMMTMYEISTPEDAEYYLVLLEDIPRYLGQIADFEEQKAERGLFMTENALDQVLETCRKYVEQGENFFLVDSFGEMLDAAGLDLSSDSRAALIERNRSCVVENILPAYASLASRLEALRGKCSAFVGACDRGDEAVRRYAFAARSAAACDLSTDKMAELLNDYAGSLLGKLMRILFSDPDAANRFGGKITSGDAETDVEYLLTLIDGVYPAIPEQKIDFVDVPEAVGEDFSPAAYLISAFDDPSRNVVMFNPTSDNNTMLMTLAHECFPGHLYQTQFFRNSRVPLMQQAIAPTGYSEGWAVFSELFIAGRASKYNVNDCLLEQYNSIICNILIPAYVSIKVNTEGWDTDDILEYLSNYGLNSEDYANILFEYSVNMPTYFFNYAMGLVNTMRIYEKVNPTTDQQKAAFFKEYLEFGPCYYDILNKHFGVR